MSSPACGCEEFLLVPIGSRNSSEDLVPEPTRLAQTLLGELCLRPRLAGWFTSQLTQAMLVLSPVWGTGEIVVVYLMNREF